MSYSNFEKEVNKILDMNLEKTTKDVSWESYDIGGESKSYPMWKSVVAGPGDTYKNFLAWAGEQGAFNDEDLTGVVKPLKPEFSVNTVKDPVLVSDYNTKIESNPKKLEETPKLAELEDKTGVVKSKSDLVANKVEKIKKTKEEKSELEDKTGVVKPKVDFGGNAKPVFDNDFSEPMEPVVSFDWEETILDKFKKLKIKD